MSDRFDRTSADPIDSRSPARRRVLRGAAWAAPAIAVATAAPAFAASTSQFGVRFGGGGGANGAVQSAYVYFGAAPNTSVVLSQSIAITISIVGLNANTTAERSILDRSVSVGSLNLGQYNTTTRTRTYTWTIPAGTSLPAVSSSGPSLWISFGDGLAGTNRITNKLVVTGVRGVTGNPDAGRITSPSAVPVDSTTANAGGNDGIY